MGIDSDPIKSFGEGIGKGIGDSAFKNISKGIKSLIKKFKDGKLAFIQDKGSIDQAKELLASNEYGFYCKYIEEEDKRTSALMGITLREISANKDFLRRRRLVTKMRKKFDSEGVHLAYLVQNGALIRYITSLLENTNTLQIMQNKLKTFLKDIDKFTYFVFSGQDSSQVADTIKVRIQANSPDTFIMSGTGSAINIISDAFKLLEKEISNMDYDSETYSSNERKIIFLNKINK